MRARGWAGTTRGARPFILTSATAIPWHDEELAIALHKPSAHIDLSGWAPRYFTPGVTQYANTSLQDRVKFGSDFPGPRLDCCPWEFESPPIRESVRPRIPREIAMRVLKPHV